MKILWVLDKYFDISVDRITWIETIRHLEQKGHSVSLLTGYRKVKKPIPDVHVKYVKTFHIKWIGSFLFALHLSLKTFLQLLKNRFDFLIVDPFSLMDILPVWLILFVFSSYPKRIVDIRTIPVESYGLKGRLNNFIFRFVLKMTGKTAHGMTVITPFMKRTICDTHNLNRFPVGVWSSGASPETFDPSLVKKSEIDKLSQDLHLYKKFVIIYHGAMTPARGLYETLEGFKLLVPEIRRNIILLLIGDGTAKKQMIDWVKKHKMDKQVCFHDPVPHKDIIKYIALADIGILPFPNLLWWRVSSPIKLMEYLIMKKSVIVTDIEAHRDVLGDAPCAIWIPDNSPESIKKAIEKAYNERLKFKKYGKDARDLVLTNYTWKKQTDNFYHFLCRRMP